MAEQAHDAIVVRLTYACDECGEEMRAHWGIVLTSNPPVYPHRCTNGHTANLLRSYPTYDFRPAHVTTEDTP